MSKHRKTEDKSRLVYDLAKIGTTQLEISVALEIDPKTLRAHYRNELDTAHIFANNMVGNKIYEKCLEGDTQSLIWWSKARMKWAQTKEITGKGGKDLLPQPDIDITDLARKIVVVLNEATTKIDP